MVLVVIVETENVVVLMQEPTDVEYVICVSAMTDVQVMTLISGTRESKL